MSQYQFGYFAWIRSELEDTIFYDTLSLKEHRTVWKKVTDTQKK